MFTVPPVPLSPSNSTCIKRSSNDSPKCTWKKSRVARNISTVCKPSFMTPRDEGILCNSHPSTVFKSQSGLYSNSAATIIIFIDNPNYCLNGLRELSNHIWSTFGIQFVLVCKEQYMKDDPQILFVCDPQDCLAQSLGCLDPLGGGKGFINSIHILDSSNRRRLFLPIGYITQTAYRAVDVGDLQQICDDCLSWLSYEASISV